MKTKTECRTRIVQTVRDGRTYEVPETYEVQVPLPPRDWDAVALKGVTVGTTVAVAGVVVWSAVAIGGLLSMAAPAWTAYMVAGVFDLAWIVCMVLEWLSRYDQDRARLPRTAGWMALAVSMALITTHGVATMGNTPAGWAVGLGGSFVSAIAKGTWTVVLKHRHVELDHVSKEILKQDRARVQGQLAMASVKRGLIREQGQTKALELSLALSGEDGQDIVSVSRTDTPKPVLSVVQDASPDIVDVPVLSAAPESAVSETVPTPRPPEVPSVPDPGDKPESIAARVRGMRSQGYSEADIRTLLTMELGSEAKTRATIDKALQRSRSRQATN